MPPEPTPNPDENGNEPFVTVDTPTSTPTVTIVPATQAADAETTTAPEALVTDAGAAEDPLVTNAPPDPEPDEPPTPPADKSSTLDTVPLARLQGVQRQLSQLQKDHDAAQDQLAAFSVQLAEARAQAAHEYAERVRATSSDLVPSLINGDTIEAVNQSIAASKAAYAAAQAHYARTIPVPTGNPPAVQGPDQRSPTQLISAGLLKTTNNNINT